MESLASQLQALLQKKLGEAIAREDLNEIYKIFTVADMAGVDIDIDDSFESIVDGDRPEFRSREDLEVWLYRMLHLKPE